MFHDLTKTWFPWPHKSHFRNSDPTCLFSFVLYLPTRGIWATYWKCACSWAWALLSCWSPSRSLSRASWGTLHPHPFRSANFVSRKLGSNSCAAGSKGRRKATADVASIVCSQKRCWNVKWDNNYHKMS